MTEFARINADVRQFGGQVMQVADAEINYPDGKLLVEPASGSYLYFMNTEFELI